MSREVVRYGRAAATTPGKHGPGDWRVTFCDQAPTHDEMVFIVGMLLLAEDRYNGPNQIGRYYLWHFLDRVMQAKTPAAVVDVAEDALEPLERRRVI